MDLILRNARLTEPVSNSLVDIGVAEGRIAAIAPILAAEGEEIDIAGRLVVPGFVETHIHLDKSCILDRCQSRDGTLAEAIGEVAAAKRGFTAQDVYRRGSRTLEKCILQGTTRIRTQVEVDPTIGLTGLEGVRRLARDYAWAVDIEICVFPQEGLLNNPGTDDLMVRALREGATVVGACPYTDSDPIGQIDRIFEIALSFGADIDMHLDFDTNPQGMTLDYVCAQTRRHGYGGRVTVGHVSKLSALPGPRLNAVAGELAAAGVAVTVLPSTDLFLMGAERDHDIVRGVAPLHRLAEAGVVCSLATNNVLNPFTPFGDGSLLRMANLYANIAQLRRAREIDSCFEMVTSGGARILRLADYGIVLGNPADLVVLDCETPADAVRELAAPLFGFKRGRRSFSRPQAVLHRPD